MIPVRFPEATHTLAMDQDEYEPIAVHVGPAPTVAMTACFRLDENEIREIVETRSLWITTLTFGSRFQPIALSTRKPELS